MINIIRFGNNYLQKKYYKAIDPVTGEYIGLQQGMRFFR